MLSDIDAHVGKYYSKNWVRKNVLRLSEDDIKIMEEEIDEEELEDPEENEPPVPAPAPVAPTPVLPNNGAPIPVVIAKESAHEETPDQDELAKSMTRFFDTLTEEANNDGEKR
jgi:hypothetical protein